MSDPSNGGGGGRDALSQSLEVFPLQDSYPELVACYVFCKYSLVCLLFWSPSLNVYIRMIFSYPKYDNITELAVRVVRQMEYLVEEKRV